MKPIRIGMVGLGRAGWGMHLKELCGKESMFEIVAACDSIPARTAAMQEKYGCRTYETIEDLVKDENVELVDIATRSVDHYAHACLALAAGKDVLLEKPACVTYAQFEDLLTRANKPGRPRLFFRQNRRFELGFRALRQILDEGKLGNVYEMELRQFGYERRDDWQTLSAYGGGQLNNWGPHLIDHALRLLDAKVKTVTANRFLAAAGGDCEDHFTLHLVGENGRCATVSISGAVALERGRHYVLRGSRGAAVMQDNTLHLRYIREDQVLSPVEAKHSTPANEWGKTGTFAATVQPDWVEEDITLTGEDLSEFWVHLYETYREGKPFPILDEEVKDLMAVIAKGKEAPLVPAETI